MTSSCLCTRFVFVVFRFVLLPVDFPLSFRITTLAMDTRVTWIHWKRLHNHDNSVFTTNRKHKLLFFLSNIVADSIQENSFNNCYRLYKMFTGLKLSYITMWYGIHIISLRWCGYMCMTSTHESWCVPLFTSNGKQTSTTGTMLRNKLLPDQQQGNYHEISEV